MPRIAERIRQGLELRGMKQSELVEATGIGKSSISTYISGAYEPKQKNIYLIAKALDVSEVWLMGYDVPMDRERSTPVSEGGPINPKAKKLIDMVMQMDDTQLDALESILDSVIRLRGQ